MHNGNSPVAACGRAGDLWDAVHLEFQRKRFTDLNGHAQNHGLLAGNVVSERTREPHRLELSVVEPTESIDYADKRGPDFDKALAVVDQTVESR
ncbi:hypothetical protein DMH04_53445 [Kibdelosporangium aridum]|uniref:Uncharacterized protein n=1 Tax=Kibdelosporangium aridum TaxID=2030 RepID=A0A428Y2Y6_KIBAR|nr:hypothetical protein DMH04_53445 [Kibdelosporangium aridum]